MTKKYALQLVGDTDTPMYVDVHGCPCFGIERAWLFNTLREATSGAQTQQAKESDAVKVMEVVVSMSVSEVSSSPCADKILLEADELVFSDDDYQTFLTLKSVDQGDPSVEVALAKALTGDPAFTGSLAGPWHITVEKVG